MRGVRAMLFCMIALAVWCGSSYAAGIFKEYPQFAGVNSMVFHSDTLWVGTNEKGVGMLDTNTGSFRFFDTRDGLLKNYILDLTVDKTGTVWVGSAFGLNFYRNGVWGNYTYAGTELINQVNSVATDNENNLWITGTNYKVSPYVTKIFRFDGKIWTKVLEFTENPIWQIMVTLDGSLWCNKLHGNLMRYKDGVWTSYPQLPFPDGDNQSYCADFHGNLWFQGYSDNTYGESFLFKYDSQSFTKYSIADNMDGYTYSLYSIIGAKNGVWCATYAGLAFFDGVNWHGPSNDFYEGRYSWRLAADSHGKIWVSQYLNGGIYVIDGNDMNVAVRETPPTSFPTLRASPNPFNASTVISYTLPGRSNIRLAVFDITGQKVCDLASGTQVAGEHRINWNAENRASGVYFVRLETDHATKVEKMLLLR